MSTNDIIGRDIDMVLLDQSKGFLHFKFNDGTAAVWSAVGGCCSHSWFESVEAFDFDGKVLRIEHGESKEEEDGCLQIDFMTIFSERGRLCLEMRNSSNGYYSGWIETADVPMGQYGQALATGDDEMPTSWKQVAP